MKDGMRLEFPLTYIGTMVFSELLSRSLGWQVMAASHCRMMQQWNISCAWSKQMHQRKSRRHSWDLLWFLADTQAMKCHLWCCIYSLQLVAPEHKQDYRAISVMYFCICLAFSCSDIVTMKEGNCTFSVLMNWPELFLTVTLREILKYNVKPFYSCNQQSCNTSLAHWHL